MSIIHISQTIVDSLKQQRDAAQALVETHEATIEHLRDLLAYFICHMPAQNPLVEHDDPLHDRMMHEAMHETGTLPFEQTPAPDSDHAPTDLSMRGGLEQVEKRIRPFSNGSQFGDWATANCDRCKKGGVNNEFELKCELEQALTVAYFGDGMISASQGARIGLPQIYGELAPYCWMCTEVEWTDEWRAEVMARDAK